MAVIIDESPTEEYAERLSLDGIPNGCIEGGWAFSECEIVEQESRFALNAIVDWLSGCSSD